MPPTGSIRRGIYVRMYLICEAGRWKEEKKQNGKYTIDFLFEHVQWGFQRGEKNKTMTNTDAIGFFLSQKNISLL